MLAPDSLQLEWLEDFLLVAKERSFTLAAGARRVSQSSLSRRIRSLELWLGGDLVRRDRVPLELTELGREFLKHAQRIISTVDKAEREAVGLRTSARGATKFTTLHTLAATFFPMFIQRVRKELHDPDLTIRTSLIVGDMIECLESIAYASVPFSISYWTDEAMFEMPQHPPERIKHVTIAKDRLIPICHPDRCDIYRKALERGEKVPYFSYSPETYLSVLVDDKLRKLGIRDNLTLVDDAQSSDTLRNIVREDGQGIAWVLHSTAQHALVQEVKELTDFTKSDPRIDLDIRLWRATDYSSPIVERIWQISKDIELSPGGDAPASRNTNRRGRRT